MTRTPDDWRVAVRAGDTLRISTTYETELASWYEAMGIFVLWFAEGESGGPDPFVTDVNRPGDITHGPLPENLNYGGAQLPVPDPRELPSGDVVDTIAIEDFFYASSDISEGAQEIPVVRAGSTLTFDNSIDAPRANGVWHTITSCKAPCTGATGVSYPLADGDVVFDSGQLGSAGEPTAGTVTWETPEGLDAGTYTFYCRIHPFMRGAFRVEPE
jgi:plastocyanin